MELFISLRYLRGKKMGFSALITHISILGVLLGTAVLIVALSISNGFQNEVVTSIIGTLPHAQIRRFHQRPILNGDSLKTVVESHPEVVAASLSIEGKSVLEYIDPLHDLPPMQDGVQVYAVDYTQEKLVTRIAETIVSGRWSLDSSESIRGRMNPGIVIGKELAWEFGRLTVGSEVVLMSAAGASALNPTPRMMRFTVNGIFKTGMYEYDKMFTYISLPSGQRLFDLQGVQFINLRVTDPNNAERVAREVNEMVGHEFTRIDWQARHKSLFEWMDIEKLVILIVISLIMVVAAFNISSSLIMMILEKRREIGILMSMGASRGSVTRIFLYNGLIIGVIGSTIGTILGLTLCYLQHKFHLIALPGKVYFVDYLPVMVIPSDVLTIFAAANIICLAAAIYPAWQASKLLPADAVRID